MQIGIVKQRYFNIVFYVQITGTIILLGFHPLTLKIELTTNLRAISMYVLGLLAHVDIVFKVGAKIERILEVLAK